MPNSAELAKRPAINLVKESAPEFAERLPATVDATKWTMQLATVVQKNPELLNCDAGSLLLASYEAAELGISLSPTLQLGYLIPYNGRVQFQISWRGIIQVAYRTGYINAFYAEVVYEHDKFERQYAPRRNLFHAPALDDRDNPIGAYALAEFKDGTIDWEFCDRALIGRHRKHSKNPDSLVWKHFEEEAWRKTPIRILAKRVPLQNTEMERLSEVIERDAESEMKPLSEIVELETESPLSNSGFVKRRTQNNQKPQSGLDPQVFYQVGTEVTRVYGRTQLLKDELPKLGARRFPVAREWRIPAVRTHQFVELCVVKLISAAEVRSETAAAESRLF